MFSARESPPRSPAPAPSAYAALPEVFASVFEGHAAERAARPWSLAELRLAPEDAERVEDYLSRFEPGRMRALIRVDSTRRDWPGIARRDLGRFHMLAGLLLVVATERGRRLGEGDPRRDATARPRPGGWTEVLARVRGRSELLARDAPTRDFGRAIEAACEALNLRRTVDPARGFRLDETLGLQFGFAAPLAVAALPRWLDEDRRAGAIAELLGDGESENASPSFQKLWQRLAVHRRGGGRTDEAIEFLRDSPWIPDGWETRILDAAAARPEAEAEDPGAPDFFGEDW